MRLAEEKIKEAILHPDPEIRMRAVDYFSQAFSPDPTVMPLVIQAVEKYEDEDSRALRSLLLRGEDLRQSDESVAWIVRELNRPNEDGHPFFDTNLLIRLLMEADPVLLRSQEEAILKAPGTGDYYGERIARRLHMHAWDEATAWRELEKYCEESAAMDLEEVDFEEGDRLAQAVAHHGTAWETKLHDLLSRKLEPDGNTPAHWMEPLLCQIAGRARLESTIPLLVDKLLQGNDVVEEDAGEALTRIGTPAVVEAVVADYFKVDSFFRYYVTDQLRDIHGDLAVEKALELLRQEKKQEYRWALVSALLGQFASEGIEAARQEVLTGQLDQDGRRVRRALLETCEIMGETFPERDDWLKAVKAEKEALWRPPASVPRSPMAPSPRPAEPYAPPVIHPFEREAKKVGRNDPCPCGSGKKYKKCCLNK